MKCIKVGLSSSKKVVFVCFNECSSKMMKNSSFISSKTPFSFLKYLNFRPNFFDQVGKRLDKKAKVNVRICDVTEGQQIIVIHILPNISRSKVNQTLKFGQLIEYNMRYTFLKTSYTKYGEEASPRPFYKKSKSSISLDQQPEML